MPTPPENAVRHLTELSSGPPLDPALRVTLNFQPDRPGLLDALASTGTYVSQFTTGTSNGGLTAHPGGDRWRWESRIFNGAYDEAPAHIRPVYGALNFRRRSAGAAPRFGSAHLRLTADVLPRTTFCYPDSTFEPTHFGVAARMSLIALAEADHQDPLDDYIEAQVHGPLRIDRDVEALVLDPSFRGTPVERAARRLPCPLEWHDGFKLTVEELRRHPYFRGPQYVVLAEHLADDGWLTPHVLAQAFGQYDAQDLKRVWHCLARFGSVS
ncbi:DUF3626 domain-containing protein [Kribbella italica]|uniref:DUF3626 domain-containing protein n=1 Tax=Kribbella italica TaxID=1540520 RepID=A0A7W9J8G3_9ACTN|nr:DUF3626 domain-containing protein [Kribbella italica]MBB5837100.1 hypothetical protein [Kribbella italica]